MTDDLTPTASDAEFQPRTLDAVEHTDSLLDALSAPEEAAPHSNGIVPGDGPLAGHNVLEIDKNIIVTTLEGLEGHCGYSWGAKAQSLTADLSIIHLLDCSGFVRLALARASHGKIDVGDGSVGIHDWCAAHNMKPSTYDACAEHDDILRVCFIAPHGVHGSHVWLVLNGKTYESHAFSGPSSRPYDTPVLVNEVTSVFCLA